MLIVTLTSWPGRINNVLPVLECISKQSVMPDKVYLNLSVAEFNGKLLPNKLMAFITHHKYIKINWVKGPNIKPFKKILPILKFLNDDDIIINIDDDMLVPTNFLESRLNDFYYYNTCISGLHNRINGYANGLLPEIKHYLGPGSVYTKKMFSNWETLLNNEIISTNHDDAFYDFITWLNGYLPESCSGPDSFLFDTLKQVETSLHGDLGCADAVTATRINIKRFTEVYKVQPRFNFFNTNFAPSQVQRKLSFIFLDRGRKADDNAEYLYRWFRDNVPNVSIQYILESTSCDWSRLMTDGFNLIDAKNKLMLQEAINNSDYFCFSYFPKEKTVLGNIRIPTRIKKIFLNHGVFYRYLSYLNDRYDQFDLMIAGNKFEYDKLINLYKFDTNKIALTGQPRHDNLIIQNKKINSANNILIQFWWRPWYKNNRANFKKSTFLANVNKLLTDKRWAKICNRYNLTVSFKLHCEMDEYRDLFKVDPIIKFTTDSDLFYKQFIDSAILVTDFTSNVYEMGIIDKPCIYYRPDWTEMNKKLVEKDGSSFDVQLDGLGPVADDIDDFFDKLVSIIDSNFKLDNFYLNRRTAQITFKDNPHCCERVFAAIMNLSRHTDCESKVDCANTAKTVSRPINADRSNVAKTVSRPINTYLYF